MIQIEADELWSCLLDQFSYREPMGSRFRPITASVCSLFGAGCEFVPGHCPIEYSTERKVTVNGGKSTAEIGSERIEYSPQNEHLGDYQTRWRRRINMVRFDRLDLSEGCTLNEAIEYLRFRSTESPAGPFSFVVSSGRAVSWEDDSLAAAEAEDALAARFDSIDRRISLPPLRNIGLADVLDLICEQSGMQWKFGEKSRRIEITRAD